MKTRTKLSHALYPGSFDVATYGHLDIIRRAARFFDKVTVAVAVNPSKTPMFTVEERVEMLRKATEGMDGVHVASFTGLTVEFARHIDANVIIRGLRAVSDFEFELQMAMTNDTLAPELTTLFMAPSPNSSFLTSSIVREIARFGGNVRDFVPPVVEEMLLAKLGRSK